MPLVITPSTRPTTRRKIRWRAIAGLLAVLGVQGAAPSHRAPAIVPPPRNVDPPDSSLWIEMRNVNLHIDDVHTIKVRTLRGRVQPNIPIAWLDDPKSFTIHVTSGTVGLRGDDLAALLNEIVFNYPGSPISRLRVRVSGAQIVQSGIMHKGVDLPFEMTATLSLEPDGRIRTHPTRMRLLGVDGLKLLHALGLHLDKVLNLKGSRGATVDKDDIILDPLQMIPPPAIAGRLRSVRVEGGEVVQEFVRLPEDSIFGSYVRADTSVHNYVYFRGSKLRFGKLTMDDTDLLIGDADERDPFDLYFIRYNKQLVAGYTRNRLNFGLRVFMADYHRLVEGDFPKPPVTPAPEVGADAR
jgi:hypothetical protein